MEEDYDEGSEAAGQVEGVNRFQGRQDELEEDNGVQESCDDILQNQNTSRASWVSLNYFSLKVLLFWRKQEAKTCWQKG